MSSTLSRWSFPVRVSKATMELSNGGKRWIYKKKQETLTTAQEDIEGFEVKRKHNFTEMERERLGQTHS